MFQRRIATCLIGATHGDKMQIGLITQIEPRARKTEIGARAGMQVEHVAIPRNHLIQVLRPDIDVIEFLKTHAVMLRAGARHRPENSTFSRSLNRRYPGHNL